MKVSSEFPKFRLCKYLFILDKRYDEDKYWIMDVIWNPFRVLSDK